MCSQCRGVPNNARGAGLLKSGLVFGSPCEGWGNDWSHAEFGDFGGWESTRVRAASKQLGLTLDSGGERTERLFQGS
jgi:hypothetical protein